MVTLRFRGYLSCVCLPVPWQTENLYQTTGDGISLTLGCSHGVDLFPRSKFDVYFTFPILGSVIVFSIRPFHFGDPGVLSSFRWDVFVKVSGPGFLRISFFLFMYWRFLRVFQKLLGTLLVETLSSSSYVFVLIIGSWFLLSRQISSDTLFI